MDDIGIEIYGPGHNPYLGGWNVEINVSFGGDYEDEENHEAACEFWQMHEEIYDAIEKIWKSHEKEVLKCG